MKTPRRLSLSINYKDAILLLIALFFLSGYLNASAQVDPTASEYDPLGEIQSGALVLYAAGEDGQREFVPGTTLSTDVTMRIRGMIAEVDVVQSFRNDSIHWTEGTYAFPLPDQAAVNRMVMQIGDRRIEGEIKEKQQARRQYEAAKRAGKQASLVSQQRPNLFTSKVANLGPGEQISVTIGYIQELSYRDGQFSVRFPMTVTPRFAAGDDQESELLPRPVATNAIASTSPITLASIDGVENVLQMNRDIARMPQMVTQPGAMPLSMKIELEPGFDLVRLESRYHDIAIAEEYGSGLTTQQRYNVELSDGEVAANRDFELVWEPTLRSAPQSTVLTERFDGEDYALMMVLPPQPKHLIQQPRELIMVIDTSGSMHGSSIIQARESLRMALGTLLPSDRFNLVQFNTHHDSLFPQPVAAGAEAIGHADEYVEALTANGGTNMNPALAAALQTPATPGFVRQVVFITDGAIGNETELFQLIENELGDARLFTVGIGAAPNSYFMHKAAEFGRGTYTLVSDVTEVAEKMDQLLSKLEHPALTGVETSWPGAAETYPSVMPDLYLNEPLMVAAKLDTLNDAMQLTGLRGNTQWTEQLAIQDSQPGKGIATLWARRKVDSLMDDMAMGADPKITRGHILETALRFALVTRFTSFVAVDKTPARSQDAALKQQQIANLAPNAMSLPQTATASLLHIVFGSLILLLSLAFAARLRDEQ